MLGIRVSVRRPIKPEREREPGDDIPFGLHPVIDLMKMVGMIAESQRDLLGLIKSTERIVRLLAYLWALVAFLVALR